MVPGSHTMAALEAERAQLIAMTTAARTLTVVAKPKLAPPAQVAAANPGDDRAVTVRWRWQRRGRLRHVYAARPGSAQSIAYNMLASFGFSPATYFGCLVDMWDRESGWRYDAENAERRVRHPAGAAGQQDGQRGSGLADQPGHPDQVGPRLHQGHLRRPL